MKYQVRKVEKVTVWEATEPIDLDPELFKNLTDNSYKGYSEEDFLNYIHSLRFELPQELENIDYDTFRKLTDLFNGDLEQKIYYSTAEKEENSWLEIGTVDPSCTKHGGFNSSYST
jgi:hypothetical protein